MAPLAETGPEADGRLAGRYRLAEPIGSGGMGRVYRAHDEVLDREVAVKLLDESPSGGTDVGAACATEARAAAKLAHPGIARVFDSGVQDGRCFVVMELVPGRPLAEVLRERSAPPRRWRPPSWPHRSPTPWRRRTGGGSSTATSSPRTSSSRPTGPRSWWTSASPAS